MSALHPRSALHRVVVCVLVSFCVLAAAPKAAFAGVPGADGAAASAPEPGSSSPREARSLISSTASANIGNPGVGSGPERRVALVIGNSNYANVVKLPNPTTDARAISQLLNSAGFEVISGTDLDHDEMIQVVQNFSARIKERGPNTVAFVYYAGHGVQIAGDNYLIPVDAKIASEADVPAAALRLVDLMVTLQAVPSRMRIVVLDACRNNPFATFGTAGRGLAIVDAPNGSIVGYSTAPGTEAFDGDGKNSPYTAAFLQLARQPNLPIEQFFKRVRLEVNESTDGKQTPWESSSLTSDFYFFGDTVQAAARPVVQARPAVSSASLRTRSPREAYEYVLAEDSIAYYEEYVRIYPSDPFADRIRWLLANRLQAVAWHGAVLANSPAAYQSFHSKYADSPYAQAALKLQEQPKALPLTQGSNILNRPVSGPLMKIGTMNGGFNPQPLGGIKAPQTGPTATPGQGLPGQGLPGQGLPGQGQPQGNGPVGAGSGLVKPLPPGVDLARNADALKLTKRLDESATHNRVVTLPASGPAKSEPKVEMKTRTDPVAGRMTTIPSRPVDVQPIKRRGPIVVDRPARADGGRFTQSSRLMKIQSQPTPARQPNMQVSQGGGMRNGRFR